jgi:hypothetical protein
LVVALNTQLRVQPRDGVPTTDPVTSTIFWPEIPGHEHESPYDFRASYDHYRDRWLIVSAASTGNRATSSLRIAVSQTGDPQGKWYRTAIPLEEKGLWLDYPTVGFDQDRIVIQCNIIRDITPLHYVVYLIDKDPFYQGQIPSVRIRRPSDPDTLKRYGVTLGMAPSVCYGPGTTALYFVQDAWEQKAGPNGLLIWEISGPKGREGPLNPVKFLAWDEPWATWKGKVDAEGFAPQQGSSIGRPSNYKMLVGDSRIQNVVFRDGSLWCAHTVFLPAKGPTRSAVQWWQIRPGGPNWIQQQGRIDDPAGRLFYAFPSIAVNKLGDALIGFARFASDEFPSAGYCFRHHDDPPSTFRDDCIFRSGLSEFTLLIKRPVRWGDYSNTVTDPRNDVDLWTIQQYAEHRKGTTSRWGTYWAMVQASGPTRAQAARPSRGVGAARANSIIQVKAGFPGDDAPDPDLDASEPLGLEPVETVQGILPSVVFPSPPEADLALRQKAEEQNQRLPKAGPSELSRRGDGAILTVRDHPLTDAETRSMVLSVPEPGLAVSEQNVLVVGLSFASFSQDGGASFKYWDARRIFPVRKNTKDVIDTQIAAYDPARQLMIWLLTYGNPDTGENWYRLGIAKGADIALAHWKHYDFPPRDFGDFEKPLLYFPDLALGKNYLYLSSNLFNGQSSRPVGTVIMRVPLDDLADHIPKEKLSTEFFLVENALQLRSAQGAGTTMYWVGVKDTASLRVISWPEDDTARSREMLVRPWSNKLFSAVGPDGKEALKGASTRLWRPWVSGGTLGFAWTAAEDLEHPQVHVRASLIDTMTYTVTNQPDIWSREMALAFPSVATDQAGGVGILLYGVGPNHKPDVVLGALRSEPDGRLSWDLAPLSGGGVDKTRWGAEFAIRPVPGHPRVWAAACYDFPGEPENLDGRVHIVLFRQNR